MLARGPRFSFADWVLSTAVIDVERTRRAKAESFPRMPRRDPRRAIKLDLVSTEFRFRYVNVRTEPAESQPLAQ